MCCAARGRTICCRTSQRREKGPPDGGRGRGGEAIRLTGVLVAVVGAAIRIVAVRRVRVAIAVGRVAVGGIVAVVAVGGAAVVAVAAIPMMLTPLVLMPAAAPPPIVIIRLGRRDGCEADDGNCRSCERDAAGGSPSRNPRLWMCHRV